MALDALINAMLSAKSAEPSTYRTETIFSQPSESDHGTSCDLDHVDRSETMARCQWRADGFAPMSAGLGYQFGCRIVLNDEPELLAGGVKRS